MSRRQIATSAAHRRRPTYFTDASHSYAYGEGDEEEEVGYAERALIAAEEDEGEEGGGWGWQREFERDPRTSRHNPPHASHHRSVRMGGGSQNAGGHTAETKKGGGGGGRARFSNSPTSDGDDNTSHRRARNSGDGGFGFSFGAEVLRRPLGPSSKGEGSSPSPSSSTLYQSPPPAGERGRYAHASLSLPRRSLTRGEEGSPSASPRPHDARGSHRGGHKYFHEEEGGEGNSMASLGASRAFASPPPMKGIPPNAGVGGNRSGHSAPRVHEDADDGESSFVRAVNVGGLGSSSPHAASPTASSSSSYGYRSRFGGSASQGAGFSVSLTRGDATEAIVKGDGTNGDRIHNQRQAGVDGMKASRSPSTAPATSSPQAEAEKPAGGLGNGETSVQQLSPLASFWARRRQAIAASTEGAVQKAVRGGGGDGGRGDEYTSHGGTAAPPHSSSEAEVRPSTPTDTAKSPQQEPSLIPKKEEEAAAMTPLLRADRPLAPIASIAAQLGAEEDWAVLEMPLPIVMQHYSVLAHERDRIAARLRLLMERAAEAGRAAGFGGEPYEVRGEGDNPPRIAFRPSATAAAVNASSSSSHRHHPQQQQPFAEALSKSEVGQSHVTRSTVSDALFKPNAARQEGSGLIDSAAVDENRGDGESSPSHDDNNNNEGHGDDSFFLSPPKDMGDTARYVPMAPRCSDADTLRGMRAIVSFDSRSASPAVSASALAIAQQHSHSFADDTRSDERVLSSRHRQSHSAQRSVSASVAADAGLTPPSNVSATSVAFVPFVPFAQKGAAGAVGAGVGEAPRAPRSISTAAASASPNRRMGADDTKQAEKSASEGAPLMSLSAFLALRRLPPKPEGPMRQQSLSGDGPSNKAGAAHTAADGKHRLADHADRREGIASRFMAASAAAFSLAPAASSDHTQRRSSSHQDPYNPFKTSAPHDGAVDVRRAAPSAASVSVAIVAAAGVDRRRHRRASYSSVHDSDDDGDEDGDYKDARSARGGKAKGGGGAPTLRPLVRFGDLPVDVPVEETLGLHYRGWEAPEEEEEGMGGGADVEELGGANAEVSEESSPPPPPRFVPFSPSASAGTARVHEVPASSQAKHGKGSAMHGLSGLGGQLQRLRGGQPSEAEGDEGASPRQEANRAADVDGHRLREAERRSTFDPAAHGHRRGASQRAGSLDPTPLEARLSGERYDSDGGGDAAIPVTVMGALVSQRASSLSQPRRSASAVDGAVGAAYTFAGVTVRRPMDDSPPPRPRLR